MGWLDRFKPKGSLTDTVRNLFSSDTSRKREEGARKLKALEERTTKERQRFLNEGLDDCLKPREYDVPPSGNYDVPLDVVDKVKYGANLRVRDYNGHLIAEDVHRSPFIEMREFTFSEFSNTALVQRKVDKDRAAIVKETLDDCFEYIRNRHIKYDSLAQETVDRIVSKPNAKVEAYNQTSIIRMNPITRDEMKAVLDQNQKYWQRANECVIEYERQIVGHYRDFISTYANGKDKSTAEYANLIEQWEEQLWVNTNDAFEGLQKTEGIYIEKLSDINQLREIAFKRGGIKEISYLPTRSGRLSTDRNFREVKIGSGSPSSN